MTPEWLLSETECEERCGAPVTTAYADKARSTSKDNATVRMLRTDAAKVPLLPVLPVVMLAD